MREAAGRTMARLQGLGTAVAAPIIYSKGTPVFGHLPNHAGQPYLRQGEWTSYRVRLGATSRHYKTS